MDELDKEHVFLYSGVSTDSRAAEGVGCLMRASYMSYVKNWKFISQRNLKIEITLDNSEVTTILVTYGPNDDEPLKVKEEYWEELNDAIKNVKGRIVILGDMNSRVGKRDDDNIDILGMQGEDTRNDNGRRMIDFCMENNWIITNTFFEHKDIHKFTRSQEQK
ncbi:uncharacterized protein [Diabrotica undecimpunctata]|uniref:uncharacterized protein n=1 Tax=Diabrotica undecimpunctata TaxID=50387 RepID=UPI003B63FF07